jgi:hypothetical protein
LNCQIIFLYISKVLKIPMRKILTRKEYISELKENHYTKYTLINEVFANDLPWGDTHIGRLINSFARKAKISFNKRRISGLTNRLKSIFDEMLEVGSVEMTDNSVSILFLQISSILGILISQVNDGADVKDLIRTSEDLLDHVNRYEYDKKEEMIKALKEFLEYLKGLKSGDSTTEDETEEGETEDSNKIFYQSSRDLLQSVVDLHMMIEENVVRIGGGQESYDNKLASAKSKLKVGNEYNYLNSKGVTVRCMLLSLTNEIQRAADKKWLTDDDSVGRKLEPDQACVVYKKDKVGKDVQDYNKVYSSQVVELLKLYPIGGKEPGKVEKPGENLSTNFNKDKYSELEKKYISSKKPEILKNLIKIGGQAIKIYTAKKDNQNSKFYTDKTNSYISSLVKMQAKSYGISTEETKDFKQPDGTIKKKPTGKHKDIKTLKDEIRDASKEVWSVDLPLGKSSGKVSQQPPTGVAATMQKASYNIEIDFDSILEEVEANLQSGESQAKNAWKKIVNSYNQSGVSKLIPEIEKLLKDSKDVRAKDEYKKAKSLITTICKQIVNNKSTVGKPISFEDLVKEDLSVNDTSKSISLMARVILSLKEDMGLIGSFGSAINPLKSFITSFSELEKNISKISTDKKESLHRYTNFSKIFEKNQYSEQIKEKFNEIFTEEVKAHFEISDSRKVEIEKSIKERPQGELVFTDADPIIEIVRLFNRAWRIHTPGVIPSGRTGGRVSNSVFREYEDLGSGNGTPDSPGSGPYRNIELFDQWNEVVQDVLSDTKYRPIFSEDAVFRFVNEETGQEGDPIERGGKTLLKFVNELLSESKMYKKGAMNNFIEEYFKLSDKQVEKMGGQSFDPSDLTKNSEVVDSIKDTEVIYKKLDSVASLGNDLHKIFTGDKKSEFEGLSFKVKLKVDDKSDTYYFKYISTENNYPILVFSKVNFPYDLTQIKGRDINKANIPINIYLSSLPTTGKFNNGSSIDLKFIEISSDVVKQDQVTNRKKFTVENVEILCTSESGEPFLDLNKFLPKFKKFEKNINTAKSWLKSNA